MKFLTCNIDSELGDFPFSIIRMTVGSFLLSDMAYP
jgi:hypothetical protein